MLTLYLLSFLCPSPVLLHLSFIIHHHTLSSFPPSCFSHARLSIIQDAALEAQAFGNLGIARLNMGHFEDAIGYLEQQLATLEQLSTTTAVIDKGRAFGNLGDCYDALGDSEEAIKCHEQVSTLS